MKPQINPPTPSSSTAEAGATAARWALLGAAEDKGGESVVPVEQFVSTGGVEHDDGAGHGAALADEVCTCPKPMFSVLDICDVCMAAKGGVFGNFEDRIKRLGEYSRLIPIGSRVIPSGVMPEREAAPHEESLPPTADQ